MSSSSARVQEVAMNTRLTKALLPALTALTLAAGAATLAHADTSVNFRVDLGGSPHWRRVNGTRVYEVSGARPDYDVFRYGNRYYAYNDNRWYMSRHPRGNFVVVDD